MYEGDFDDGMEYEEEMPEDDEDNISDEDEDEGMGPIEGLSGDHGVDVEVIMEDDEDDDDEDDEDDDSSDDDDDDDEDEDDEDGSDGMQEDAHIEILDEAGNVQQIAADEDLDEWESDNGEGEDEDEIDYEGEGADEEEAHVHSHSMNDLGNLVRVLAGGGDEDDAVEILQRMEDEGVGDPDDDEGEPLGEYIEGDMEIEDEGKCYLPKISSFIRFSD